MAQLRNRPVYSQITWIYISPNFATAKIAIGKEQRTTGIILDIHGWANIRNEYF